MRTSDEIYRKWHWGIQPSGKVEWNDPDYPEGELIECGRLVEVHYREPGKIRDTVIKLNREEANGSHLCFDPEHRNHRLYILSNKKFQERVRKQIIPNAQVKFRKNGVDPHFELSELAHLAGGRHASNDYPELSVTPLGTLTHVTYACEKGKDKFSYYIHAMGEESGVRPYVGADGKGRLWIAGGNYTVPTPGITD